jgi:hypothetical protein
MPNDTQHWCPQHGLHGEWDVTCLRCRRARRCCAHVPIADYVLEDIESAAIARSRQQLFDRPTGLNDAVEAERERIRAEAIARERIRMAGCLEEQAERYQEQDNDDAADALRVEAGALRGDPSCADDDHTTGPDYVAQHDARVKLEALADLASWLGIHPEETDPNWEDSPEDARNAILDRIENRCALKGRDARVRRQALEDAARVADRYNSALDARADDKLTQKNNCLKGIAACTIADGIRALAQQEDDHGR